MKYNHVRALLEAHGLTGGDGFYGYRDARLHPDHPITAEEREAALEQLIAEKVREARARNFAYQYQNATYGEEAR